MITTAVLKSVSWKKWRNRVSVTSSTP